MSIKKVNNIFDLINLCKYLKEHNDGHIYVHIHYNNNNVAYVSILLIHIIYIVNIISNLL